MTLPMDCCVKHFAMPQVKHADVLHFREHATFLLLQVCLVRSNDVVDTRDCLPDFLWLMQLCKVQFCPKKVAKRPEPLLEKHINTIIALFYCSLHCLIRITNVGFK